MKERPILFSAPMVRALLDASKTQTRRAMSPQPPEDWTPAIYDDLHGYDRHGELTPDKVIGWGAINHDGDQGFNCRYGKPGDRLWVKETHLAWWSIDPANPDGKRLFSHVAAFKADGYQLEGDEKWIPSIHMRRVASRINLEVINVRVERLQDISEADAKAEGCEPLLVPPDGGSCPYVEGYCELWETINGAGSWDENPWVWVVEFKLAKP